MFRASEREVPPNSVITLRKSGFSSIKAPPKGQPVRYNFVWQRNGFGPGARKSSLSGKATDRQLARFLGTGSLETTAISRTPPWLTSGRRRRGRGGVGPTTELAQALAPTDHTRSCIMTIIARKRLIAMAAEFLKAFPMLEDVLIESWQEGAGVGNPYTSTLPSRRYGLPHSVASRGIECANRNCKTGGFDIFRDIAQMVNEKATVKEFTQICCGDEGTSKGKGRDCVNTLHYRLTLEYKPSFTG